MERKRLNINFESLERVYLEMKEERLSKLLEESSNLTYKTGEEVLRNDLIIDLYAKERFEKDPENNPYGYYAVVHRINEDDTVDLCLNGSIALKMNYVEFDSNNFELVQRDAEITSPFDNLLNVD